VDIPVPLVDLAQATREAKARVHALRAQPAVRAARSAIVDKHGSRGPLRDRLDAAPGTRRRRSKSSPSPAEPTQQTLDL
jgi:deoxyribodipyrimidine photo-lyase